METVKGRGRVIRTSGEALLSLVTLLLSVIVIYILRQRLWASTLRRFYTWASRTNTAHHVLEHWSLGEEPKQHTCYKNWGVGNSSSSREPAIISDGCASSVNMYNVKYAHLIADGNGSVYKRVL